MNRCATIVFLSATAIAAFGQGEITFLNSTLTFVRTNATGLGGTAGNTAPNLGGFAYAVFTAAPTVTTLAPLDLLTPAWTFTGLYATNVPFSTGGRLFGGFNVPVPTGWPPGVTNSFAVAGWSANVSGNDWNLVAAQLAGATFQNGVWTGPNWSLSSDRGFFGVSSVGFGVSGSPGNDLPTFNLFGTASSALGTPIQGFDLFVVNAPEPSTWALAGMGATFLMTVRFRCRRRRKRSSGGSPGTL